MMPRTLEYVHPLPFEVETDEKVRTVRVPLPVLKDRSWTIWSIRLVTDSAFPNVWEQAIVAWELDNELIRPLAPARWLTEGTGLSFLQHPLLLPSGSRATLVCMDLPRKRAVVGTFMLHVIEHHPITVG